VRVEESLGIAGILALAGLIGCFRAPGRVERRNPDLGHIVADTARVEALANGFGFTEGPVWMNDGSLLFGDLPNNVIRKWTADGEVSVVRARSGYSDADKPPGAAMGSNGMALDSRGRLTICEPGNRRITRIEADGTVTVIADRYEGKRLNSPNDLVYKSDGSLYFTDPPHGLVGEDADPTKELDFNGIFRYADGKLELLSKEMTRPNGLAFSPDEKYLYVANADPRSKIWERFEVASDGLLSGATVLLDLNGEPGQPPDGMKVDREGNLYCTGPGGLWIVTPSGGILGVIRTRHEPSNCAWGDDDRRTLYITGQSELYRVRLLIPGAGCDAAIHARLDAAAESPPAARGSTPRP
jgi:gluconolactonase